MDMVGIVRLSYQEEKQSRMSKFSAGQINYFCTVNGMQPVILRLSRSGVSIICQRV